MYYRKKRFNKIGLLFMVPYLLIMGVGFDMIFLGNKFSLFLEYQDFFKKPIKFQMMILNNLGIGSWLENNLSFYKTYLLITAIMSIFLYNVGRVLGKKMGYSNN